MKLGLGAGWFALAGCGPSAHRAASVGRATPAPTPNNAPSKVAVAKNGDAKSMVRAALEPFGGIEAFVKDGDYVVLKPNCGWARTPDQAANTSPETLLAVAELCKEAGAKRIAMIEHTCANPASACFDMSGLAEVMDSVGGEVVALTQPGMFRDIDLPKGVALHKSTVAKELDKADVFINIPVPKDHAASVLTGGLKNLMGVTWDRGAWHNSPSLHQAIADYATVVRPHLTIVDAMRILLEAGPSGPGPTRETKTIAVATDPVAADTWACSLFDIDPIRLEYLTKANAHGLGECDASKLELIAV